MDSNTTPYGSKTIENQHEQRKYKEKCYTCAVHNLYREWIIHKHTYRATDERTHSKRLQSERLLSGERAFRKYVSNIQLYLHTHTRWWHRVRWLSFAFVYLSYAIHYLKSYRVYSLHLTLTRQQSSVIRNTFAESEAHQTC